MNKQLYNAVISTPQYMLEGNFRDLEILGGEKVRLHTNPWFKKKKKSTNL